MTAGNSTTADKIYLGGDIITIDEMNPAAEAVAIKDGRIAWLSARKLKY